MGFVKWKKMRVPMGTVIGYLGDATLLRSHDRSLHTAVVPLRPSGGFGLYILAPSKRLETKEIIADGRR
jgi:hypothetical protein